MWKVTLFFNLNRETSDTAAFNSWHRRAYLISDPEDPAQPRLIPTVLNQWRRNLILTRNYYPVGYVNNGNGVRCDDGASWYNHSENVMYIAGVEFNGGQSIWSHSNLIIKASRAGWLLCSPLPAGGGHYDTYVDCDGAWGMLCGDTACSSFWSEGQKGQAPAIYQGDWNVAAQTDPHAKWDTYWCGVDLKTWVNRTKAQDAHTVQLTGSSDYTLAKVLAKARRKLWGGRAPVLQSQPASFII